jgi:predicted porin
MLNLYGKTMFSRAPLKLALFIFATAACTAARADEVTLYGLVDSGVSVTTETGSGSSTKMLNGGQDDSLWGLRGTETLSAGWRANFQLENGFNPSSGTAADNDRLFNYNAWAGLAHESYGEIRLGRQYTVGQQYGNALELASWKDMGMGATFKAADNYQFDNLVSYYSPQIVGIQVGMGYSFNAGGAGNFPTADNNRAISAGIKYEKDPWLAVLTWEQLRLADPSISGGRKPQAIQLGLAYDFEVVKVSGGWSRQRNGYVGMDGGDPDGLGLGLGPAAFVRGGRVDAWLLGASVPIGKGTAILQWSLATPNWRWDNGEKADTAQVITAGYVYTLSPRTSLYAFGGFMYHYNLDNQFQPSNSNNSRIGMGITHRF